MTSRPAVFCAAILFVALAPLAMQAQDCERCPETLTLVPEQAACFLSQLDEIRARAAVAPPALVNFGACATGPRPDAQIDQSRGDARFIVDDVGCTGACPPPALYAFLMPAQIDCLADRLGQAPGQAPSEQAGATIDLRTCP